MPLVSELSATYGYSYAGANVRGGLLDDVKVQVRKTAAA